MKTSTPSTTAKAISVRGRLGSMFQRLPSSSKALSSSRPVAGAGSASSNGGVPPQAAARRAAIRTVVVEAPAMCGVRVTFSSLSSRASGGGGSCQKVSSMAPRR